MKNKVDKGYELIYWNLSYRRKFIRTLCMAPLIITLIGFIIFSENNMFITRIVPILSIILYIWQLTYTYNKWKKDE